MMLGKKSRHSRKNKSSWLKKLAVAGLVVGMTLGGQVVPSVQAAYITPLEKPLLFSQDPALQAAFSVQKQIWAEAYQEMLKQKAETSEAGAESVQPAPPIYTRSYDEVGSMTVYLTVDDGPSKNTARILDILDQYQAKATFFMLEPAMAAHSEELVRMAEEGHALGMHGVTHKKELVYKSADSVVEEMLTGQARIAELTGVTTTLFRAPYGSKPYMTADYRQAVLDAGLSMWDWNVDSLDWKYRSDEYVAHTITQLENLKAKGRTPVILIHDTEKTADSLPQLLDYLVEHGYRFALADGQTEPIQFPL